MRKNKEERKKNKYGVASRRIVRAVPARLGLPAPLTAPNPTIPPT